jgi:hypothetical protein
MMAVLTTYILFPMPVNVFKKLRAFGSEGRHGDIHVNLKPPEIRWETLNKVIFSSFEGCHYRRHLLGGG